jgi:hypothetical protein
MRLATLVVAVIAAALIAGCDDVAAPKPDPAGDPAFVSALKVLCAKTPALVPVEPTASAAAITDTANADSATLVNFVYGPPFRGPNGRIERHGGLSVLTPRISNASPLALPITDAAQMLVDMSKWYTLIVRPADIGNTHKVASGVLTATARWSQARRDLAKIGVNDCFSQTPG